MVHSEGVRWLRVWFTWYLWYFLATHQVLRTYYVILTKWRTARYGSSLANLSGCKSWQITASYGGNRLFMYTRWLGTLTLAKTGVNKDIFCLDLWCNYCVSLCSSKTNGPENMRCQPSTPVIWSYFKTHYGLGNYTNLIMHHSVTYYLSDSTRPKFGIQTSSHLKIGTRVSSQNNE